MYTYRGITYTVHTLDTPGKCSDYGVTIKAGDCEYRHPGRSYNPHSLAKGVIDNLVAEINLVHARSKSDINVLAMALASLEKDDA
jgi:hypothetical protein